MDKDKIVNALNAIQNGQSDGGEYHDELEVAISVLMETSEETIAASFRTFMRMPTAQIHKNEKHIAQEADCF